MCGFSSTWTKLSNKGHFVTFTRKKNSGHRVGEEMCFRRVALNDRSIMSVSHGWVTLWRNGLGCNSESAKSTKFMKKKSFSFHLLDLWLRVTHSHKNQLWNISAVCYEMSQSFKPLQSLHCAMTHIRVIVKMVSNMSKTDGELKEPTLCRSISSILT